MSDHILDATKMIQDTPRMEAALLDAPDAGFANIWKVGCEIERELNAANAIIRQQQLLEEENDEKHKDIIWGMGEREKLMERVKRLEEAGDALAKTQTYDLLETVNWRKAKEAKP